jgi:hypothetical protein
MQFEFVLFSPRKLSRELPGALEFENQAFEFWQGQWQKIYDDIGASASFKLDDFYRQDSIGTILGNGRVVALWTNSKFNLRAKSTAAHSYFKFYGPDFIKWLETHDIEDVISLEFFTVANEWKRAKTGPSLARVMASLANEILLASNSQALIAPARVDVGVAHLAAEIGYECVVPGTIQRGFQCDLIACRRENVKPTPHAPSRDLARRLWHSRVDVTSEISYWQTANQSLKRAA